MLSVQCFVFLAKMFMFILVMNCFPCILFYVSLFHALHLIHTIYFIPSPLCSAPFHECKVLFYLNWSLAAVKPIEEIKRFSFLVRNESKMIIQLSCPPRNYVAWSLNFRNLCAAITQRKSVFSPACLHYIQYSCLVFSL